MTHFHPSLYLISVFQKHFPTYVWIYKMRYFIILLIEDFRVLIFKPQHIGSFWVNLPVTVCNAIIRWSSPS